MSTTNGLKASLHSSEFRLWVDGKHGRDASLGMDVMEASDWADLAWRQVSQTGSLDLSPSWEPDLPDRLYALSAVIEGQGFVDSCVLKSTVACYDWLAALSFPAAILDEKTELLKRFAYLAWRHSRRLDLQASATTWESRTVELALAQEAVPEFLEIEPERRSESLNLRFFSDKAVLVAVCDRLRGMYNKTPAKALRESIAAQRWVEENSDRFGTVEEYRYFLAVLAHAVAIANKHCGRYDESERWLAQVDLLCAGVDAPDTLRARADFLRLAICYQRHLHRKVLEDIPALKARCTRMGLASDLVKCSYLEAVTLKELGRDDEALAQLERLRCDASPQSELCVQGLVLVCIAEIRGRRGQNLDAMRRLSEARALLEKAEYPMGHFHAVQGELLRDQGQLSQAADSYRAAVNCYQEAGMAAQAVYLRVILAETLLAAGREHDAIVEIVGALPLIEGLGLVREGVAAVALLRESLRRGGDPEALRVLLSHIENMGRVRSENPELA